MKGCGLFKVRVKRLPLTLVAVAVIAIVALEIFRAGAGENFTEFESGAQYNADSDITLNEDRPASLFLPANYSAETPVPLLINLHGYTGKGSVHSSYTYLQGAAKEKGLAYVAPDGTEDSLRSQFWNASTACCNFNGVDVDDVAYIKSLIDEASSLVAIDPKRIYLFGHSNGHFMSYKFACSTNGVVAAVAGLAGAMDNNLDNCTKSPTNILHIHGTSDQTILYNGGALFQKPYPSVDQSLAQWSEINSCTNPSEKDFDLMQSMVGSETTNRTYSCTKADLELWRINNGLHTPTLDREFANKVLDWLLARKL
jgi:polyhydroxybutyrate depolymerase